MVTCACNSSAGHQGRVEIGGSWELGSSQPTLKTSSSRLNEKPRFKGIRWKVMEQDIQCLVSVYAQPCAQTDTERERKREGEGEREWERCKR